MSDAVMPDYPKLMHQLFAEAAVSPYLLAPLPEQQVVQMSGETLNFLKGAARIVFAELLTDTPQKWQPFWFIVEPTYLRLFRYTDVFVNTTIANQRWLYLLYLQFCQEFPELAPVTPIAALDDIL